MQMQISDRIKTHEKLHHPVHINDALFRLPGCLSSFFPLLKQPFPTPWCQVLLYNYLQQFIKRTWYLLPMFWLWL